MVGPRLARVTAARATLECEHLSAGCRGQLLRETGNVRVLAKRATVLLVMDDEHGNLDMVERHRRDGTTIRSIGENRRGQDDPVRTALGRRELGGDEGDRLRAATGSDEPHRNLGVLLRHWDARL